MDDKKDYIAEAEESISTEVWNLALVDAQVATAIELRNVVTELQNIKEVLAVLVANGMMQV